MKRDDTKKNFTALSGNDLATVLFHYLSFPCFFAFVTISEVCRLMRYRSVTNALFRFFCSENRNFFVKTNHRRGGFIENVYMKNVQAGMAQRVLEIDTEVLYQWKDLVPTYEERITRIDGIYMDKVTCESADAIYELKGDAKLPVKNVTIKNVKVGEVKKFVKKVNNVENVVEKNVTYEREVK